MIYAIQSGKFVKLGYSRNPAKRLLTIRISSPTECVLLGVADGSPEDEKLLHKQFAGFWVSGEWFELNEVLAKWISENMKPFCPPASKPDRKSRGIVDEEEIESEDDYSLLLVSEQAFDLLSEAIEKEGWSINRIAQEAGVSRVGLQRWYGGSRTSINMETFNGLCRWLGVTLTRTMIPRATETHHRKPTKRIAAGKPNKSQP